MAKIAADYGDRAVSATGDLVRGDPPPPGGVMAARPRSPRRSAGHRLSLRGDDLVRVGGDVLHDLLAPDSVRLEEGGGRFAGVDYLPSQPDEVVKLVPLRVIEPVERIEPRVPVEPLYAFYVR